jgi:hypothetical protein
MAAWGAALMDGLTDEQMFAPAVANPYPNAAQAVAQASASGQPVEIGAGRNRAVTIDLLPPDAAPQTSQPAAAPQPAQTAPQAAPQQSLAQVGLSDEQMFAPHTAPGIVPAITGFMANLNRGLGIGDEMVAGANAGIDFLRGRAPKGIVQSFKDEMAQQRTTEDGFSADHPLTAALARGAGMAAPAAFGLLPGATEAVAGSRIAALAKGAVGGGATAYGYGLADSGDPMERIKAANASILPGMALGAFGGAFSPVASKISPDAASLADHELTGVDALPAIVGSTSMQKIGQILKGIPMVGQPLVAAADRTSGQLDGGIQALATQLGKGVDPLSSGTALQKGAQGAVGRYQDVTGDLYKPVNALEANPEVVPLGATHAAINEMFSRYPNIPDWLAKNAPSLARVRETLANAPQTAEGIPSLTFGELKSMRSDVGKMVNDHLTVGNIDQSRLKNLYGAMSDDMMGGAGQLGGPDAQSALSRADTYNAAKSARISNVLDAVIQAKSPEDAYSKVLSMAGSTSRADLTQLGQLKRSLDPDAWNDFSSGVIQQMGRDPQGKFSPDKFVTAWSKMNPDGKKALFGEISPDLDAFARVANEQKSAGKFYNHSGSGSHMISAMLLMDPLLEGSKALMEGKLGEAALSIAAPAVTAAGGHVGARLLANPGWGRAMLAASQSPANAGQIIENYARQNPSVASLAQQAGARLQQNLSNGFAGVSASIPNQQSK